MAIDLVVLESIKGISEAVGAVASTCKEMSTLANNKRSISSLMRNRLNMELQIVEDAVRQHLAKQRQEALVALLEDNIKAIKSTQDLINSLHLEGEAYIKAVQQLELLSRMLTRNVEFYYDY